jgi:hypothetical protein
MKSAIYYGSLAAAFLFGLGCLVIGLKYKRKYNRAAVLRDWFEKNGDQPLRKPIHEFNAHR